MLEVINGMSFKTEIAEFMVLCSFVTLGNLLYPVIIHLPVCKMKIRVTTLQGVRITQKIYVE